MKDDMTSDMNKTLEQICLALRTMYRNFEAVILQKYNFFLQNNTHESY